jgi:hypothetical protein
LFWKDPISGRQFRYGNRPAGYSAYLVNAQGQAIDPATGKAWTDPTAQTWQSWVYGENEPIGGW